MLASFPPLPLQRRKYLQPSPALLTLQWIPHTLSLKLQQPPIWMHPENPDIGFRVAIEANNFSLHEMSVGNFIAQCILLLGMNSPVISPISCTVFCNSRSRTFSSFRIAIIASARFMTCLWSLLKPGSIMNTPRIKPRMKQRMLIHIIYLLLHRFNGISQPARLPKGGPASHAPNGHVVLVSIGAVGQLEAALRIGK